MNIYNRLGVPSTGFASASFFTSWLLPTYALATIRCLLSVYCFTTIFYSWAWFATHQVTFHLQDIDIPAITFEMGVEAIGRSFSYFTYLSYWGLAFYFAIAGVHTFVQAKTGITRLDRWPRPLQALHSILYSSIVCLPFLASSVYWASMWVGPWFTHDFDSWSAVSIHALNSLFATFEIVFARTQPLPWLHLGVLLVIMALYLGLAYLTKATAGVYVYLWLDPEVGAPKIIAHIVGYTMAIIVIFNLVRSSIWLRCRLTGNNRFPDAQTFDRQSINSSSRETLWTARDIEMLKPESRRMSHEAPTIPKMSFDRSSIDPSEFPVPEPAYRPRPRRSSSYHVQNFSRPVSTASTMSRATKHSGFWV